MFRSVRASRTNTLSALFEAQVSRHPKAEAVKFNELSLNYAQLNGAANRLAAHLRGLGVGPFSLVGIYLHPSIEAVVGMLATLKAGAAYLPLDPTWPAERLDFVLGDSRPQLVITQSRDASALGGYGGQVLVLDHEDFSAYGAENLHGTPELEHLACVHYTEGPRPRGVLVTQQNVSGFFTASEKAFGFGPGEVWAASHTPAQHMWMWEIFGALLHGGKLVIVPDRAKESGEVLRELLAEERVTVWTPTSESFYRVLEAEEFSRGSYGLRTIIFGNEILPGDLRRWLEGHSTEKTKCFSVYGCAEATLHAAVHRVTRADEGSLGRPLPGVEIHLVDGRCRKVTPGEVGEILIGGVGVARGYLHDPALTDTRFIPNPAQPGTGERLYRTGELARELETGELEFLGRKDERQKLLEPALQEAA